MWSVTIPMVKKVNRTAERLTAERGNSQSKTLFYVEEKDKIGEQLGLKRETGCVSGSYWVHRAPEVPRLYLQS